MLFFPLFSFFLLLVQVFFNISFLFFYYLILTIYIVFYYKKIPLMVRVLIETGEISNNILSAASITNKIIKNEVIVNKNK